MKNKVKLMAFLTACSTILTGCNVHIYDGSSEVEIEDNSIEGVVDELFDILVEPKKLNEEVLVISNTSMYSSNTYESLSICDVKANDVGYKILSCDNNWVLVNINNQIGYVYADSLEFSSKEVDLGYKHTIKNDIVLTTTELNFRTGPFTSASKITGFSKGTELQVIASVDNGWLLVKNNGVIGYVHGDYVVSLLDTVNLEYPEFGIDEINVKKVIYADTTLNVRNGYGIDYDKIGQLNKYESARVIKDYGEWYFVMANDYTFGFVNSEYTRDITDLFVVVDVSEQTLYLHNNDQLYYQIPVTTGKDSTPSDIGLFSIYSKETDRYLVGADYKTFVSYWMPYNGGEGLHDATWHNLFGTQAYKTGGSHGCINLPPAIADDIYESVSVGTKVLVHK